MATVGSAIVCDRLRLYGNRSLCDRLRSFAIIWKPAFSVVLYGVMRNLDAIIRVWNYVRLNPGLQRARSLWSGASDKLIMPILPAE